MRIAIVAAVLSLAACGDAEKSFKSSFEKSFADSCTTSAMNGGVPAEKKPIVATFCGCVGKKLVEKHSVVQLTSMAGGQNKDLIEAAAQECKPQ